MTLREGAMQFHILGPLEAVRDGSPIPLGGPRQRAVLARLLLDAGRVVPADRLVDDVWGGRPPATAAKTLQKYVSELRKLLKEPVLRTSGSGYVIDVDDDALDARRFERLVAAGDVGAALALWRGELLADLADSAFAAPERARLDELRLAALEARLDIDLALGRHAEVAGELAELVETHPLRERLWALLMIALYRSGRQVESLRAFERHRRALAEELGLEPSADLRRLEASILRQDPELDVPGPSRSEPREHVRGNLPHALSSFVGRAGPLEETREALAAHRLVTLTGPGGVGKTRLAIEAASRAAPGHPGGAWLVDLAMVPSAEGVVRAVVETLPLEPQPGADLEEVLVAAVAQRPPTLLLLDNCEHVASEAGRLVGRLLRTGPDLMVLATSRRPLEVEGECVRPVAPMTLPDADSIDELLASDAVRLFTERARLARAEFRPEGERLRSVALLCRRLDGLPLAIELAASQLRVLEPEEIAARLDHLRFPGRAHDGDPRQRTLHDTIAWSYDLLAPATRRVFDRLGVFVGSLTLEAAEAVCTGAGVARADVLDHITSLVDQSLLVRDAGPPAVARYRLLETMRLFALERLAEAGSLDGAWHAHASFFLRLASTGGAHLYGPGQDVWLARLQADEPNFRIALSWAAANDRVTALRLALALCPYWDMRWREREAVPILESLTGPDPDVPPRLRAWGLAALAEMAANPGEARRARSWAEHALDLLESIDDPEGRTRALMALGSALGNEGALDHGERVLNEALDGARALGDSVLVARSLNFLGSVVMRRGDHDRAGDVHQEELALWSQLDCRSGKATALRRLGVNALYVGQLDEAESLCQQALALWDASEETTPVAHVRTTLADIARVRGDDANATVLYEQALEEFRVVGDRRCTASTFKNLGMIAARRGDHATAATLFVDGLTVRHDLGDDAGLAECLEGLAGDVAAHGAHEEAVVLLAAAGIRRDASGAVAHPDEVTVIERVLGEARASLGPRYLVAWDAGAAMSSAEAVAYAITASRTAPAWRR